MGAAAAAAERQRARGKELPVPPSLEQRLYIVSELLLRGINHRQIALDLAQRWQMGDRQVRNYIKAVYDQWRKAVDERDVQSERGRIWDRVEAQYMKADAQSDVRAALLALDRQARLIGAYAPEKVDVTSGGKPVQMGPEQIAAELEAAARLAARRRRKDEAPPNGASVPSAAPPGAPNGPAKS